MSYLSPTLTLLVGAVKKATASLDRDFNEIEKLQSSVRGYQNFVSRSFERVAQTLKGELSRVRPGCRLRRRQTAAFPRMLFYGQSD